MAQVFYTARKTIKNLTNGGNVLLVATALALIVVNLPFLHDFYNSLWTHELALQVGLEIKREVLGGEVSSFRQALLPIVAAIGGMVVPVGLFFLMGHGSDFIGGAAIPMATDIAFSLGVLAMLGNRVPISLKVFLTTLAVVDDIGGILVIAIFYSSHISYELLFIAALLLGILVLGGKLGIQSKVFYLGIGAFIWFLFLNAGIHPTIAGVLIAFCVPATPVYAPKKYIKTIRKNIGFFASEDDEKLTEKTILTHQQLNWLKEIESASDKVISPLQDMEDSLHPIVNYIIVPLFAFANAGIFFGDLQLSALFHGVAPAIIIGLIVGKFLGIFLFSWLCIKLNWAPMPDGCNWKQLAAVSMLGGIGFTVSLFIANLSFGTGDPYLSQLLNNAKLGILVGSFLAGFLGWLFLYLTLPKSLPEGEPKEEME